MRWNDVNHMKKFIFGIIAAIVVMTGGVSCQSGNAVKQEKVPMEETDSDSLEGDSNVSGSTANIKKIMRSIVKGDAESLASMTIFPIERPYPLKDIVDSADMVERFHQIFDKQFRAKMARSTMKAWRSAGWRGYCFGDNSDLWVYDSLIKVLYISPQEDSLRTKLLHDEKTSLHKKLQGDEWVAYNCYKDEKDGSVIRIDLKKDRKQNDKVRMAIYRNGTKLSDYPDFVAEGELKIEGSMRVKTLVFPKTKEGAIEISDDFENGGISLTINEDYEHAHTLIPVYWLDLVSSETENVRERLSVLKKRGGAHNYREFFIEEGEEYGYHFMVYDSCHHSKQEIVFGKDEYMNMGVGGMYAFASPDKRYIYVVGDILANSTGWVSTFIVYQVDTETLKAKLVDGVAAVRQEKNGFTLCTMSRCLTPDTISADMDFAFRDVTYGFDGKIKRKSKEYSSKEIKTRYGASLCNVKGLGINRGDY